MKNSFAAALLLGGALLLRAVPATLPAADPALYQRYLEISRLAEAGRDSEALALADALIKSRPDAAAVYALRARLIQQEPGKRHSRADAEADLRRAAALDPEEALYARELGELLVGGETVIPARRDEAASLLEKAAALDPLDGQSRTILFYLRREQGRMAEALKAGRAAIKLSAQNLRLRLDTATLLAERGEKSEAVNQWIVVLRRGYGAPAAEAGERLRRQLRAGGLEPGDALRIRAALHEDDPADAGLTRDYAAALLEAGRPADALTVARAAQAAPGAAGTDARSEKLLLTVAWQAGRLDLALAQAEVLMRQDPADAAFAQSAAFLRAARGDFAGALALFNGPLLTGARLNDAALRVKALVLLRTKRTGEGLALLAAQSRDGDARLQWFAERCRSTGRAPTAAQALAAGLPAEASAAVARLFGGDSDPALLEAAFASSPAAGFDQKEDKASPAPTARQATRVLNALRNCAPASAAALAENWPSSFAADADFSAAAAESLAAAGRPDQAISRYEALREGHPDDAGIANNLAYLLLLHQPARLAEAAALAGAAVARDPENGSYLDTLAWAQHLNGRDELALPLFEQALRNGGRQAVVVAHLAVLRGKSGDAAAARALFAEARALAWTRDERREIAALAAIVSVKPAIPARRRHPAKKPAPAVKSP